MRLDVSSVCEQGLRRDGRVDHGADLLHCEVRIVLREMTERRGESRRESLYTLELALGHPREDVPDGSHAQRVSVQGSRMADDTTRYELHQVCASAKSG